MRFIKIRRNAAPAVLAGLGLVVVGFGPQVVGLSAGQADATIPGYTYEAEQAGNDFGINGGDRPINARDTVDCSSCSGGKEIKLDPNYWLRWRAGFKPKHSRVAQVTVSYTNPSNETVQLLVLNSNVNTQPTRVSLAPTGGVNSVGKVTVSIQISKDDFNSFSAKVDAGFNGVNDPTRPTNLPISDAQRSISIDKLDIDADPQLPPLNSAFFGPADLVMNNIVFRIDGGCGSSTGRLTTEDFDRSYLSEQWKIKPTSNDAYTISTACAYNDPMKGKALHADIDSTVSMQDLVESDPRFQWRIEYNAQTGYQFINVATGKALDHGNVASAQVTTSTPVDDAASQRWRAFAVASTDSVYGLNTLQ